MKRIEISQFPALTFAGQEAFNTLCTNLSFAGEGIRRIMITSSHPSEGKSYLGMHLMRTMAQYGKRVVLVDADFRRSLIGQRYGLRFPDGRNREGLAHFLAGLADEEQVVYETSIPNALLVPVGREVSNPMALLTSGRFGQLLDHLAERVDYVLVDAPPIGTVVDAAEIAKFCDGTLLVVSYNNVTRREVLAARAQLEQTGCPILGTVLNMVALDHYTSRKYYYKSYHSYYSHEEERDSGRRKKHSGK
ncbi:MAG: CpsD/CapB family tyrosine-protein kinase [Aristaeellaceae bacterium]